MQKESVLAPTAPRVRLLSRNAVAVQVLAPALFSKRK